MLEEKVGASISEVVIVGNGARTSVGASSSATAAAVRAGISAFADHPYMIGTNGAPMVTAMDAFLPQDIAWGDRIVDLGMSAVMEAMDTLKQLIGKLISVDLMLALPAPRPGFTTAEGERVSSRIRQRLGESVTVRSIQIEMVGNAGGLMLVQQAMQLLHQGGSEFCLLGGTDSYLEPETLEWLDARNLLHSKTNSLGFIPGEGAGFVLLCLERTAKRLNLKVLGRIVSASSDHEPTANKTNSICVGEGLTRAVKRALNGLPSQTIKVAYTICDLNGEPSRGTEWGYTMVRLADRFVDGTNFVTPTDCWGDVGAASGPLYAVLSVIAASRGYSPGPHTLIWTCSEGGQRSAALVQAGCT